MRHGTCCSFGDDDGSRLTCLASFPIPPMYAIAASGSTYSFTTTASDGKIITWDLKRLGLPDLDIAAVGLM